MLKLLNFAVKIEFSKFKAITSITQGFEIVLDFLRGEFRWEKSKQK